MGVKKLAPFALALSVVVMALAAMAGCATRLPAPKPTEAQAHAVGVRAAVAAPTTIRVMPLGASVTWGTRSRDGNGYRQVLLRRLFAAGLDVEFVGSRRSGQMGEKQNEGHPGFRIDQIAAGVDRWLAASRPSVVLLNVGSNDAIQNHDVAGAPARMHALIDQILADRPGCDLLVSTLIPSPIAVRNQRVDAFNAQLPAIVARERRAGRQVYLVDLNGGMTAADIGSDHIHPTEAGYGKIANRWFSVLAPLLRSESHPVGKHPADLGQSNRPEISGRP